MDIDCADVQLDGTGDGECKDPSATPTKTEEDGELPLYRPPDGVPDATPTNSTKYDSVGIGPPPNKKYPVRTASTFYTPSQAGSPNEFMNNRFEESFSRATPIQEESEGLVSRDEREEDDRDIDEEKERYRSSSWMSRPGEWWSSWKDQISKLFVPQWRRTVILMWIIWGSMSFCEPLFSLS